jgi:HEAT repeat protein
MRGITRIEKKLFDELNVLGHRFRQRAQFHSYTFSGKDKEVIPILIRYIDRIDDERIRCLYLSCLGVKGFYDATEYLLNEYEKRLLPEYDSLMLASIAHSITRIHDLRYIDRYLSFLDNEKIIFGVCPIIKMLGDMKVEKSIPHIIRLLDTENKIESSLYGSVLESLKYSVSQEAIKALAQFQNPDHTKYIEKFLKPENISWIKYPDTKNRCRLLKKTYLEYRNLAQRAIENMGCQTEKTTEGTMFIKDVLTYDGYYAEYIVTDGEYDLRCMDASMPWPPESKGPEKDMKIAEIVAFSHEDMNVKRTDNSGYIIKKGKRPLGYHLQAKIVDKDIALVAVGGLIIEIDQLSETFENGEFIEFDVDELDCYIC